MTTLYLETEIAATPEVCFNIARDIGIHVRSAEGTNERVVAGRLSGLCEAGDRITWEATHFGVRQRLTVEITSIDFPHFFEDRMIKGAFKSMRHEHYFEDKGEYTEVRDVFIYEVPFGFAGRLFDRLFLKRYMTRFLLIRNSVIKEVVERGQ